MRAFRKLVVWPAVLAAILVAFGAVTYVVAQPIALIVDRAAWSVGLADPYATLPGGYLDVLCWAAAALLCTAFVRWLGRHPSVSYLGRTAPPRNRTPLPLRISGAFRRQLPDGGAPGHWSWAAPAMHSRRAL